MSKARDLADGTFDTDTLVVDAGNNRVGIGTSSPQTKFTVQGPTTANNIEISGEWIQSFNRGGSPGYQVLPIYASAVTMPLQPAFVAYNAPATLTASAVIVWDSTALNRGSVYNTSNGRFTAPVAGLYQFFASIRIESGSGTATYHRIVFRHNGTNITKSQSQLSSRTTTGYYTHSSNDQMVSLSAGDYVDVIFDSSVSSFSTSARDEHIFYGYLIG